MTEKKAVDRIQKRKENAVHPEEFLREVGAIEAVESDEKLRFTDSFESTLAPKVAEFDDSGVTEADLARIFDVEESDVTRKDRPYIAYKIINTIRPWPSEAALTFDAATDAALREETEQWKDVPPRQRYNILRSLRSFQDYCFFCEGEIAFDNEPVQSCCSEGWVITLHCSECDRRFLEFGTQDPSQGQSP